MNKLKLFVENFIIYGLGGIISKIIPLIMIPVVTSIMPSTDYYGISDLSNTIIQFGSAVAVMGMFDAMYRMFFEKEDDDYKKDVCSTTLVFTASTSIIVFVLMVLLRNQIARYFLGDRKYYYVVYLSAIVTLVGATNLIVSAPTRMQNKRRVFLITNTVGSILAYAISIPMLLAGYYVIALPLSAVLAGSTLEITFFVLNHKWFQFKRFNIRLLKQLIIIALPLLPNFLIYWIFNSCDKVMITNILGISEAGVYSVGSKLGHCSQLIYTAFAGGWQFFAFSTMREKNQIKSNSLVFEYLGAISFVATSFICVFSYLVFKVLFKAEYLNGYIVAPYLFLAPLLQMLFQVAANQFLVVKKTWPNIFILSSGAVINVLINYFLIPILGIEGASIATLVGYIVSDLLCVFVLCRMKLMVMSIRFLIASLGLLLYFYLWRVQFKETSIIGVLIALGYTVLIILLYKEDLCKLKQLMIKPKAQ